MSDGRRTTPDWVVCAVCRAVYAPSLVATVACPKCGSPEWLPSAIPDGDKPLEPPIGLVSAQARWM
jgi:hypothetical protein